jgi:hypothetical protein
MSPLDERRLVDETNFKWIVWGAADDMLDPDDMLLAAITIENVAKSKAAAVQREEGGKKTIEYVINARSIVYSYETLQDPSQCIVSFRTLETMATNVPESSVALVSELYRAYQKSPAEKQKEMQWIANSKRYLRTRSFFPLPPYQFADRMRAEMTSLYKSESGAEFFAFKPELQPKHCGSN